MDDLVVILFLVLLFALSSGIMRGLDHLMEK